MNTTTIFLELTDYSNKGKLTIDGDLRLFNRFLASLRDTPEDEITVENLEEKRTDVKSVRI